MDAAFRSRKATLVEQNTVIEAVVGDRLSNVASLYYIAFSIYLIQYFLEGTNLAYFGPFPIAVFCDVLKVLSLVFLAIKLCTQTYTARTLSIIAVCGVIAVVCLINSVSQQPIFIYVFIISAQGISFRKVIWLSMIVQMVMLLAIVSLALFGIVGSSNAVRANATVRYSLGFQHPNLLAAHAVSICCCYMVLYAGRFDTKSLAIFGLGYIICWFVADSRTSSALIVVIALIAIAYSRVSRKSRKSIARKTRNHALFLLVTYLALLLISLYLTVYYDPSVKWEAALNTALSSRYQLANFYYDYYGPSPFGIHCDADPVPVGAYVTVVIDNAFANALIRYGIVPSMVLFLVYASIFHRAYRIARIQPFVLACFVFALMAVTETSALHIGMNVFIVGSALSLYGSAKESKKEQGPLTSNISRYLQNSRRKHIAGVPAKL